jgi:predicted Zn-dependent protease
LILTVEEIRASGKAGWQKYGELTVGGVQMNFCSKPKHFGRLKHSFDIMLRKYRIFIN